MSSFLLYLMFLFGPATAQAQIYTWTDSQDVVHYSDVPHPNKAGTLVILPLTPYRNTSSAQNTSVPLKNETTPKTLPSTSEKNTSSTQTMPVNNPELALYCAQAAQNLTLLQQIDSRVHYVTPDGEYHYLNDSERSAEIKKTQQQLQTYCRDKPSPEQKQT